MCFKIFLGGNVNAVERDFLYLQWCDTFPTHSFKFTSEFFEDQCVNYFLLCFKIIDVNGFKFEKILINKKRKKRAWSKSEINKIKNIEL